MSQTTGSCGRTRSIDRTRSWRKAVGTRSGKPKYYWSKARRRRCGWVV